LDAPRWAARQEAGKRKMTATVVRIINHQHKTIWKDASVKAALLAISLLLPQAQAVSTYSIARVKATTQQRQHQ
jgi:hypothetical protein